MEQDIIIRIIEAILFAYFYWRLRTRGPDNEDLDKDIGDVISSVQELESKQTVFHQEIFEYMDGVLQPLNKRMATRLKREEKDINTQVSTKQGGIIPIPHQ